MNALIPLIRRFTKVAGTSRAGVDLDEAWLLHGRGERFTTTGMPPVRR